MSAKSTLLAEMLRKRRGLMFPTINGPVRVQKYRPLPTARPFRPPANAIPLIKASTNHVGRLLGIEIEYYPERSCGVRTGPLCHVGSDGSLGNSGQEIRKLTWASGDGRLQGLLALKLKGSVDERCGLHVHVDVRHLGKNGLASAQETYNRLCSLYPFIKRLVPKSRWENQYCRWANNSPQGDFSGRYAAINYEAFQEHGTLEFRCQAGSTNLVKIETWALLCQYLVNWCAGIRGIIPPKTFIQFLNILPEPFKTWARLRALRLHSKTRMELMINERSLSANQPD